MQKSKMAMAKAEMRAMEKKDKKWDMDMEIAQEMKAKKKIKKYKK